jgi:hypothetical protein
MNAFKSVPLRRMFSSQKNRYTSLLSLRIQWNPLYSYIILFLGFIFVSESYSKIIAAASGTQPDLQLALDSASVGDTVQIPAGTFSFNGSALLKAGITLMGTGSGQTTLAKIGTTTQALIVVDGSNLLPVIITGIGFIGIDNDTTNIEDNGLQLNNCRNFRVCSCTFRRFGFSGIITTEDSRGVIDHCRFTENFRLPINSLGYGVAIYGDGNANWEAPLVLGTENAVFVEDCYFERCRHGVASNNGSKYVFRHNIVTDNYNPWTGIDAHGLSSSPRGSRSYEIYENTVKGGVDVDGTPHDTWAVGIRGGDGVIFNNTITSTNQPSLICLVIDGVETLNTNYPQPDQTTDLWLWGNTQANEPLNTLRLGWNTTMEQQLARYLQEGRDYHFQQKSGYSPYPYPHPLNTGTAILKKTILPHSDKAINLIIKTFTDHTIDFYITSEKRGLFTLEIYTIRGEKIWSHISFKQSCATLCVGQNLNSAGAGAPGKGLYCGMVTMNKEKTGARFTLIR